MSKTDKTRPYDVKVMEHPKEHHDHRNGVCDLGPGYDHDLRFRPGRCYIDAEWWRPEFRCHCGMCSGNAYGYGPKQRNRRLRQAKRKDILQRLFDAL